MYTLHGHRAHDNIHGRNDILDESGRKVGEIANSNADLSDAADSEEILLKDGLIEGHLLIPCEEDPKPIFICGSCDMVVNENARECRFCGAEFEEELQEDARCQDRGAIGDTSEEAEECRGPLIERYDDLRSTPYYPCSAEKVDVLSMMGEGRAKLWAEHAGGAVSCTFISYSRILRDIEDAMTEAEAFGAETDSARRTLLSAWNACHDGKWAFATQLADESKRTLAASVSGLVKGHILCMREAMVEVKRRGRSVTPFVIEIKMIQKALDEFRLGDAIRMTKEMMAEIKSIQMHILDSMDCGSQGVDGTEPFHGDGI